MVKDIRWVYTLSEIVPLYNRKYCNGLHISIHLKYTIPTMFYCIIKLCFLLKLHCMITELDCKIYIVSYTGKVNLLMCT